MKQHRFTFIFLSIFLTTTCFSQITSTKIFIEDKNYFFVETDSINKNGLILRNSIDSVISNKTSLSRYLHVGPTKKHNNWNIHFDIFNSSFYSATAYKMWHHYHNESFLKVSYIDADTFNDSNVKRVLGLRKTLGQKHEDKLAISLTPINQDGNYMIHNIKEYSIFFDITHVDTSTIKMLVYNKWTNNLESWIFNGQIKKMSEITSKFKSTKWKIDHYYEINIPIERNFISFMINEETYLITNDGTIYQVSKELIKKGKLPDNLDNGLVIINKKTQEVHYIKKEEFRMNKQPLRKILEGALKLDL